MKKEEYIEKYGLEAYQRRLEQYKAYREKHKAEIKERRKERSISKKVIAQTRIRKHRQEDKKYNRETTITAQWYIDNVFNGQRCFYCNESDWKKLGVDRINNKIGHTPTNCVVCCKRCNEIRGKKTVKELLEKKQTQPKTFDLFDGLPPHIKRIIECSVNNC